MTRADQPTIFKCLDAASKMGTIGRKNKWSLLINDDTIFMKKDFPVII